MRKILAAALLFAALPFSAQAVQNNGFSLTAPQGVESFGGRVALNDAASYGVCLRSDRNERVDVELLVNGRSYGSYSLSAYGSTCLDRMVPDSPRVSYVGHGVYRQQRPGLNDEITARFVPLREWSSPAYVYGHGVLHHPSPYAVSRDYDRAVTLSLQAEMRPGPWIFSPWASGSYWGF